MSDSSIKEAVREKYAEAALKAGSGGGCGCGTSCCSTEGTAKNPVTSDLYSAIEAGSLPEKAVLASLGCGNPTALAELKAGETGSSRAMRASVLARPATSIRRSAPLRLLRSAVAVVEGRAVPQGVDSGFGGRVK